MKGLEKGKDTVKKICDVLRKETLEPAKIEADEMVQRARQEAETLLIETQKLIDKMLADARDEIQREKNVFQASLNQACKQALSYLKLEVEEKLFNRRLGELLSQQTRDPKVIAALVTAVVKALDKEGTEADLSVAISSSVPAREVNLLLAKEIIERLKEKSVLVSSIGGGIEVKIHQNNMTLDLTDAALKELIARYIRKDFREVLFETV
jgi:V/A-type H+-transporting ATPase subunit E